MPQVVYKFGRDRLLLHSFGWRFSLLYALCEIPPSILLYSDYIHLSDLCITFLKVTSFADMLIVN